MLRKPEFRRQKNFRSFHHTDVQESFVSEEDARLSVYSANSCFLFIITVGLTTGQTPVNNHHQNQNISLLLPPTRWGPDLPCKTNRECRLHPVLYMLHQDYISDAGQGDGNAFQTFLCLPHSLSFPPSLLINEASAQDRKSFYELSTNASWGNYALVFSPS